MKEQNKISQPFSMAEEQESYANQGKLIALGTVVKAASDKVWVETERNTGCQGCSSESGCGTSALAKLFSPKSNSLLVLSNTLGVKMGDRILLSIEESDLFKHSMMAYGLPLFAMIGLAWVGLGLTKSDLVSIVLGFLGLGFGWWFAKRFYHPQTPKLEKVIQVK